MTTTLEFLPPELSATATALPVHVEPDRSLRVKIIDACGLTCTFCHNEGTPVSADNRSRSPGDFTGTGASGRVSLYLGTNGADFIATTVVPGPAFADMLRTMRHVLDIDEVHFTGGEPSLHPNLPELVAIAAGMGLTVGITSNGEAFADKAAACAEAGLGRVNFSVFGTTPAELAAVQGGRIVGRPLAERKLRALHESINACLDHGIAASANIVVPGPDHVDRVERLIAEHSPRLTVRLLNSLADGRAAINAILTVLDRLGAEPVRHRLTAASSNARTEYRLPDGRKLVFKQLRAARLPLTCSDCRFNNPRDCQEGYYGVRVYLDQHARWQVGVCLQRMDLCQSLEEFVHGPLLTEILTLRETEYHHLTDRYRTE